VKVILPHLSLIGTRNKAKPFIIPAALRPLVSLAEWLTDPVTISRHLVNAYFLVMALISLVAVVLAIRTRFKWMALYLWAMAGLIGLVWEASLFLSGSRDYALGSAGELLYHALTEGGSGLVITFVFANWIGIIDADRYRDPAPGGKGGEEG
jgi:hypothetical protein